MSTVHRLSILVAATALAGCASVSPDGLRSDVAALAAGRTGGVAATLPNADRAARAKAQQSIQEWLAQPLTQDAAVRLRAENKGKVLHEIVIGTKAELDQHAEMMKKHPGMEHDEPYMAHVAAGKTGDIVWHFNRAGRFDFACLIPGHYQAGMTGTITVLPRNK